MVTKLLERAIEIEGLLRIIRDGNPLPETYTLLSNKAVELAEEAMLLEERSHVTNQETEPKQTTESETGIVDDSSEEDEDDILLTFDDDEEKPGTEDTIEEPLIEIKEEEPKEDDSEKDIELINEENEKKSTKMPTKLKSAFSLNDRFLYSREIFDGKMKMFDSTLEFIEDIDNFSVIEDFFYNEMELNPDNPSVISFMEILRPHFINDKR